MSPQRFQVCPPTCRPSAVPAVELGRLGPGLAWLAEVQGSWPPHVLAAVRTVQVDGGSIGGPAADAMAAAESGAALASGEALASGAALADEVADAGVDLLVVSGVGAPVPGVVAIAALLDLEPVTAVGTSGGPSWAAQVVAVRKGLRACRSHLGDPMGLLDASDSPVLARLVGLLAQSAVRRTPVLLDAGPLVAAAALVAERLAPGGRAWWLAGQQPVQPAAAAAVADLGLVALLDLGLSVGDAATFAADVLQRAVAWQQGLDAAGVSPPS